MTGNTLQKISAIRDLIDHTADVVRLANFLQEEGSPRDPVTVVADAIDYWIDNASWKQEALMPETLTRGSRGYTWKYMDRCLFLAHGTEIRQPYKGKYHYAKVESDEIKYNGTAITPGKLANAIACCSCNAWTHLWISCPGDTEWTLADRLSPSVKSKAQAESVDKMLGMESSMPEDTDPLDDLWREAQEAIANKRLRLSHPYVVDLIRVLDLHGSRGLARQSVLRALEKNRQDTGLPIPPKFGQAVQGSYNRYCIDSMVFAKRNATASDGLFYSPEGKGSGVWAVNRDRAAAWLKVKLDN